VFKVGLLELTGLNGFPVIIYQLCLLYTPVPEFCIGN